MDKFVFTDALTGDTITQNYETGVLSVLDDEAPDALRKATSIFFPGCSMINYAMPLVDAVYKTLLEHNEVDGISLLCCGKILSYEPNGENIRAGFENQLRERLAATNIKRIVCACPNCVAALRNSLSIDEQTRDIELVALPALLAQLGYKLDPTTVAQIVKGDGSASVQADTDAGADVGADTEAGAVVSAAAADAEATALLCTHDSCPDREYGDFADGLRAIMPNGMWVDPEHTRSKSICCGSLPRAAGKMELADKCADTNGAEALAKHADAIVTACMSCTYQLNMAQKHMRAYHFLELLYNWPIDWSCVGCWMKVRFLFNDTMGVDTHASTGGNSARKFEGLSGS